jgi:hypothetical protein
VANEPTGFAFIDGWSLPSNAFPNAAAEVNFTVTDRSHNFSSPITIYWAIYGESSNSWPAVLANRSQWSCQQLLAAALGRGNFPNWDTQGQSSVLSLQIMQNSPHYWFLVLVQRGEQKGAVEVWPISDVKYEVLTSVNNSTARTHYKDGDTAWRGVVTM